MERLKAWFPQPDHWGQRGRIVPALHLPQSKCQICISLLVPHFLASYPHIRLLLKKQRQNSSGGSYELISRPVALPLASEMNSYLNLIGYIPWYFILVMPICLYNWHRIEFEHFQGHINSIRAQYWHSMSRCQIKSWWLCFWSSFLLLGEEAEDSLNHCLPCCWLLTSALPKSGCYNHSERLK